MDNLGRRPLTIIGTLAIVASSVAFGYAFSAISADSALSNHVTLVCSIVFIPSFWFSLGSVCDILISEFFPQAVRDRAVGFVAAFNVFCAILVSIAFLKQMEWIGFSRPVYLNAGIAALGAPFWFCFLPKTKGKSLEEIEQHWIEGKNPSSMSWAKARPNETLASEDEYLIHTV